MTEADTELSAGLKDRHVTMISIASVIGAGLFVGSANAIASAGPGVLIAYAFAGVLVILVMRMLGEMAAAPEAVFATLLATSGAIALLVYLVIAVSQLRLRGKLEADGVDMPVRMWASPG